MPMKNFITSLFEAATPTSSAESLSRLRPHLKPPKTSSSSAPISKGASAEISSLLSGIINLKSSDSASSSSPKDGVSIENALVIPWFSDVLHPNISQRRKELLRERKKKWIFKNTQNRRFERLVKLCADKLGTEATLDVFSKLGRENGVKEYNALIKICIEKAQQCVDEEGSSAQIHSAVQLLRSMKEQGLELNEDCYGPLLLYLANKGMSEEFLLLSELIKDENCESCYRLGYYEMLLWINADNQEKIQELCDSVGVENTEHNVKLAANYFLALCENDKKLELLRLLEVIDIRKVSSSDCLAGLFKALGRLSMEDSAEKYIFALKATGIGVEYLSSFICDYTISLANLEVEKAILILKKMHKKLEMQPSTLSYEKLIQYCCESCKVHAALDVVEQMCQSGVTLSVETLHPILCASEQSCEHDLVRPIYSVMRHYGLKPTAETFRFMINLCVKMKDFEGAYNFLTDLEDMNMMPTANMYNAIMAGYFREKNTRSGLMVLKQMEHADVKPNSETFFHLISNSECEEDLNKYYEEMKKLGIQVTKHVHMALINAYTNFGKFDKAKQVVIDHRILDKNMNEIKGVLVSALACNGQVSDALGVYDETKEAGSTPEPKAIISLIDSLRSEGNLHKLLQLLCDLNDVNHWCDGCGRIVNYCVRFRNLSCAVELLKLLKEKDELHANIVCDQLNSQFVCFESTVRVIIWAEKKIVAPWKVNDSLSVQFHHVPQSANEMAHF
ncbi:hypothetical protein AMTR_s00037p00059950 [Amborella trichopoda]|uniref:PROP1-like PPR domain-containing protein n=1 Tax=Amborella trichopoda TaxID=13333 RepID=U5D503_AMBTC|nr:hypothetical protein AMTR_s00037p00059950 [Amborella trichopoda]